MRRGRAAASRPGAVPTWPEGRAELAWLDGILAHASGDATGLARARRQVHESGSAEADLLERSLAAFAVELTGDRRTAARALASVEWESAEHVRHHERSEEHTSELQSRLHLVCRLLLEKKKKNK